MTSLLDRITQASMLDNKLLLKNDKFGTLVSKEGLRKVMPTLLHQPSIDKLGFKIEEQNRLDRDLLLKNDKIGKKSHKRNQQVKPLTKVQESMIETQEQEPTGYEYVDEDGVKRFRRYDTSVEQPDLEDVPDFISGDQLDMYRKEINNIKELKLQEYEKKVERYEYLVGEEQYFARLLNEGKISMDDFKYEMRYLLGDMDALIYELAELQQDIDVGADEAQKELEEKVREHNRLVKLAKDRNKEKIRNYQDALNVLNSSAFKQEQLPSETEQEYLQRLQQNAMVDLPEDVLEEAKQKANVMFRSNLSKLTRDQVKIELIANSFVDEPEKKFELNKIWSLVETKFRKIYGNAQNLDAETIAEFLHTIVRRQEATSELPEAVERELFSEEEEVGKVYTQQVDTTTILYRKPNIRGEPSLYLRCVIIHRRGGHNDTFSLLYSFTGAQGSFKEYFDTGIPDNRKTPSKRGKEKSSTEIKDKTGITIQDLYEAIGESGERRESINGSSYCKALIKKFRISPVEVQDTNQTAYQISKGKPKQVEYGMGIHKPHEPKLIPFGQVSILYNKLKNENTLAIKTHQGKSIGGLPNKKISKKLVTIILDLIEGVHPTHDELTRLDKQDRIIYDKVVYLGKLHTHLPHTNDTTIHDLKKRLKLLEGEIEIGNNSPQLKHEISEIIKNLVLFKTITPKQAKEYLKQI